MPDKKKEPQKELHLRVMVNDLVERVEKLEAALEKKEAKAK